MSTRCTSASAAPAAAVVPDARAAAGFSRTRTLAKSMSSVCSAGAPKKKYSRASSMGTPEAKPRPITASPCGAGPSATDARSAAAVGTASDPRMSRTLTSAASARLADQCTVPLGASVRPDIVASGPAEDSATSGAGAAGALRSAQVKWWRYGAGVWVMLKTICSLLSTCGASMCSTKGQRVSGSSRVSTTGHLQGALSCHGYSPSMRQRVMVENDGVE